MIPTTRIGILWACLALLFADVVVADESAEKTTPAPALSRPYRDGPLTAADFAAARPADSRSTAWTEFDYEWTYGYRHERQGKQYVATLTQIQVWVIIRRDKSWNTRPRDPLLMDHEQGHFDLAQIGALEAQRKLLGDIGGLNALTARGTSREEAEKKLEARVISAIKPFVDAAKQANVDYDAETSSGRDARAQATARKVHRQRLQELQTELEKPTNP